MIRYRLISFGIICLFLWSCANQTQPTGGPKDEDPPILISSTPKSGTLNFKSQTIQLVFSEMVKADKIQTGLIITPSIKSKYKVRVVKNRVTLSFEEPLDDSTTYTLNFRESIKDVTESNPAEDLIVVFSTGSVIDSLQISGHVETLLTNELANNYTVALYQSGDTLDLFNSTPFYAIQTEDDGTFQFRNIKADSYKLYAWRDKNNDLKCQSENEPYGFLLDPIQLDSNKSDITIKTQSLNLRPLKITASRQQGKYYEVRFSKRTTSYSISSISEIDTLYHHYIDDMKAIRIYNNQPPDTEYFLTLNATDSAGMTVYDTLQFTFQENSRPSDAFEARIQKTTVKSSTRKFETEIKFTKPILDFTDTSWRLTLDSTYLNLSLFSPEWYWADNTLNISAILPDSLTKKKELSVNFPINSFQSIESDSSKLMTQKVSQLNPDNFGIIELRFDNDSIPFKIHLLNSKGQLKMEYPGQQKVTMEYLDASQYKIRILIDSNNDGIWQPGNFFENRLPEPLQFFYDEEAKTSIITLKKNWVLGPFYIILDVDK